MSSSLSAADGTIGVSAKQASSYGLPRRIRRMLNVALAGDPEKDAASSLATFLGKNHAAPDCLGRVFALCRRALSKLLGISERKIRRWIKVLEAIGFLVREPDQGFQPARDGKSPVWRKPTLFRFGPSYFACFAEGCRRAAARLKDAASHVAGAVMAKPGPAGPPQPPGGRRGGVIPNTDLREKKYIWDQQ